VNSRLTLNLFFVIFFTFSLGTYLSIQELMPTLYLGIFYVLALYILKRSINSDFFISSEKNRFTVATSKLLVHGQALPTVGREELQEERYMNHFQLNIHVKRQFFTYFFLALAVFVLFLRGNVPLSLASIIPIVCGFFFIKSVYIGHLLVPLILNIYSVIAHYEKNVSLGIYGLYIFLVFWTLKSMSEVSGEYLKWKKTLIILPAVVLFSASIYGLSYFFEHKQTPQEKTEKLNPARKALRQARTQSNSLLTELSSLPENSATTSLKQQVMDQLQDISKLEETLNSEQVLKQKTQDMQKMLGNILDKNLELTQSSKELKSNLLDRKESGLSPTLEELAARHSTGQTERLKKLSQQIQENQEKLFQVQNSASKNNPNQETKELEKIREELKAEFEKTSHLSDPEKNELFEYIEKKQQELKVLEGLGAKKEAIENQTKNLEGLKELSVKATPNQNELNQISQKIMASKKIDDLKAEMKTSNQTPLQQINESQALKAFDKKPIPWKKFLPLLILALGFLIVSYFMKKKGIKEVEILDPELLKELKEEWRRIKKLKLTPREEVIYYYNILHDVFQKVHYPEHETPPSCIVFRDMKELNPNLNKATFLVTEIYTQCFYGNKEVNLSTLKSYRRSINSIMQVYGL
jgi:hypothetical protein